MGYSAKQVANHFLQKYGMNGIAPLKLQKLVFIAHGWHLAIYDQPLVDDEYAEAWKYGPVFPSLYHEFKHRGALPIIELATDFEFSDVDDVDSISETTPEIPRNDENTRRLLDKIWDVYGKASGIQLSNICHEPGTPWDLTRKKIGWRSNSNIADEIIKEYYKLKIED